ncbi:MAG TPA: hypothetical protein VHV83_06525, partial [Armatimonadota bacterium]|nr:hypothetical protein [Armatimonadota bacterium]
MMLKSLIWDNPVLVKHLRSRLRLQHLIPLMAVVVVIAACIIWYGFSPREYGREEAIQTSLTMLLILQGLILFLGGSAQLAGTVVNAREQGMLDFHRMSPQRPVALALGFLLGAPIREYILFACTLPFIVPFIRLGQHGTLGMFGILLETIVVSLLYNVLALVLGLVNPKPRGSVAIVIIIVVALQLIHVVPGFAYLTIFPTAFSSLNFTQQSFTAALFGHPTAPIIVSLLNQVVLASFLFYVAVRKIRHERAYAYARPVAILFYLVIGVMIMADMMAPVVIPTVIDNTHVQYFPIPIGALPLVTIYTMFLIGLFVLPAVTPKAGDFIKGIRHARKQGLSLVPPWSDLAANWPPVLACGTLLLLLSSVACLLVQMRMHSLIGIDLHITRNSYLACVLATFTLIAYGLAK